MSAAISPTGGPRLWARGLTVAPSPDRPPVVAGAELSLGAERLALVGNNGAGKTTLLRALAGELSPQAGEIVSEGPVGLLRQTPPRDPGATVADRLDPSGALAALLRLLDGRGGADDAAAVGERWDLEERALGALDEVGLGGLSLHRPADTLSGGEEVRVRMAGLLLAGAGPLLLDEPTNHLDRAARRWLRAFVAARPGVLVVSHDRELLSEVDAVVELRPPRLLRYGDGLAGWQEGRAREAEAAERARSDAEKAVTQNRREAQAARERQERKLAKGRKLRREGGVPRVVLGKMKERSEGTTRRVLRVGQARTEAARSDLEAARVRARVHEDPALGFVAEGTAVPAGKTVVEAQGLGFGAPDGTPILEGLDLCWRGSARVAVSGANGAGKSTLLQILAGRREGFVGSLHVGARVSFFDQELALPAPEGSVLENLRAACPELPPGRARERLAAFLFPGERAFQAARTLSGGERLRLALACALSSSPPPELLILDEPTNHLDLVSTEHLEAVLRRWPGALVVSSHDERFLSEIGVADRLTLCTRSPR